MSEEKPKNKYPGWRTMSSSSRYNAKLHNTFEEAKKYNAIHDAGRATHVAKKHGGVETYSSCKKCFPTSKSSAVKKALDKHK